jgi:arachidonate 15-lipoxygenase
MVRIAFLCAATVASILLDSGVSAGNLENLHRQNAALRGLAETDLCSGQSDSYLIPALDSDPVSRTATVSNFTSGFLYEARPGVSPGPGGPEGSRVRESEFQAFQANNGPWILGTVVPQAQKALAEKSSFVPTKLDDYNELYNYFGEIPVVNKMDFVGDDRVFARQMFTSYPHILRRVQKDETLPFKLADEDLPAETQKLMRGDLVGVANRGHLFIADLSHLKEAEQLRQQGEFMGYPIAVFAWDHVGNSLIPLAIQILGKEGPVYTKKDSEGEWLLAKIFFNNGAIQDQQVDHFVSTHLALEPLKIAAYRQLATSHPVRVLLEHYLKIMFGNNVGGFRLLFPKDTGSLDVWSSMGGVAGRVVMDKRYSSWTWEQDTHANQISSRGIGSLISAFDYYQDALSISAAVRSFVTDYLRLYYSTDSAVADDTELTAWAAEAASPDFGNVKGFPSKFSSID